MRFNCKFEGKETAVGLLTVPSNAEAQNLRLEAKCFQKTKRCGNSQTYEEPSAVPLEIVHPRLFNENAWGKIERKKAQGKCAHCDCTNLKISNSPITCVILTISTKMEINNVWKPDSETTWRIADKALPVYAVSQKQNPSREYESYIRYLIHRPPTRHCECACWRSNKQSVHEIHDDRENCAHCGKNCQDPDYVVLLRLGSLGSRVICGHLQSK